jgi:hypothetical protein
MYGAYSSGGCSTCGGSAYSGGAVYGGGMYGSAGVNTVGGSTITTTDGKTYVRGADGSYYEGGSGAMSAGQPVYGTAYGTMPYYTPGAFHQGYYGSYPGAYQTGYYGGYPGTFYNNGVYPAGAQTMPGVNLPGGININPGGITIPNILPNK